MYRDPFAGLFDLIIGFSLTFYLIKELLDFREFECLEEFKSEYIRKIRKDLRVCV